MAGGSSDITVRLGLAADGVTRYQLSPSLNQISVWCELFVIDFGNAALTCPQSQIDPTAAVPTVEAPSDGAAPIGTPTATPVDGAAPSTIVPATMTDGDDAAGATPAVPATPDADADATVTTTPAAGSTVPPQDSSAGTVLSGLAAVAAGLALAVAW